VRHVTDARQAVAFNSDGERKRHSAKALDARRKEILRNSEADRFTWLKKLQEIEREVQIAATLFERPVQILSRHGLGGERREHYENQLRGAGPDRLRDAARLAVANGDRDLGAEIQCIVDSISSNKRPVKVQELAERLAGDE
jgi:hypothetical protein